MRVVSMSDNELQKLDIIKRLDEQEINPTHVAQLLNRSVRQTQYMLTKHCALGVRGLVSKKRGRPSNPTFAC